MAKKIITVFALIIGVLSSAQNKKIIYGFDKIPQGLLINPGAETTYKYHIGVPLLSGASAHMNISGITLSDVFRDDSVGVFSGTDFTDKLSEAVDKLGEEDYVYANSQIDVLNGGYKINSRDYLNGGFYIETDIYAMLPKDVGTLLFDGNEPHLGETFEIDKVSVQAETVGVFHVGLSRRFNERLTAGARVKLYSGSASIVSNRNAGGLSTERGGNGVIRHTLSGLDFKMNSSSIWDENNDTDINGKKLLTGALFKGNFGAGFDLGFTYHFDEQSEMTGSLLDVGFVSYSKNLRNVTAKGDKVFTGVDFKFDGSSANYWGDLRKDIDKDVPNGENKDSYIVVRPIKANIAYAYSFGRSKNRSNCHDNTYKDFFDNTVGGHIFSVVQPRGLNLAYTLFYQRKMSKMFNVKATYTIDDFSYSNIGLGASLNVWKVNLYGTVGNIFRVTNIGNSHTSSLQAGVNFIVN